MTSAILVSSVAVLLSAGEASARTAGAACFGSKDVPSPDGTLLARVTKIGRTGCGESEVRIIDRMGRILADRSFRSGNGEHGEGVQRAAWSSDGHFFAFSLTSSGGHEAQHFPTLIYFRTDNQVRNVEDLKPGLYVAGPDFQFRPAGLEVSAADGRRVVVPLSPRS